MIDIFSIQDERASHLYISYFSEHIVRNACIDYVYFTYIGMAENIQIYFISDKNRLNQVFTLNYYFQC